MHHCKKLKCILGALTTRLLLDLTVFERLILLLDLSKIHSRAKSSSKNSLTEAVCVQCEDNDNEQTVIKRRHAVEETEPQCYGCYCFLGVGHRRLMLQC